MSKVLLSNEAELLAFGRRFAGELHAGDIIALEGPLGAGKTTLVRGLIEGLGGEPNQVHSPTFSLVHEYSTKKFRIFHCDFYRLAENSDLYDLGGLEFFDSDSIYFLEWAERISSLLGHVSQRVKYVKITMLGTERQLEIFPTKN